MGRRQTYLTFGLYVVLSTAFCWPLFSQPLASGSGDWDQHLFYYAAVLRNAAYGDLPFWNPWYCGGNVLWANPQASLISPVYLLSLVMPITLAMKFNVLGHYIVGCVGMHLVIRRHIGVRSTAMVVYLVSLFVFAGAITFHVMAGHTVYLPVFLLPWVVYFFYQGTARSLLLGAGVIGVIVLNGGMHVLPLAAVLLGVLGLGALLVGRTLRPMVLAAAMFLFGCAYAAPRVVPASMFVRGGEILDTRPVKDPDFMSMEMLRIALFDGTQDTRVKVSPGVQLYGWHEYGNYMGWFGAGLALACAGGILIFRRRREYGREASAAIGFVVILVIAAGEFATWAPASVMRDLPFFSSFRAPSRYMMLLPLVGALCIAFTARAFEDARGATVWRRLVEIVCVVGICQLVLVNRQHLRDVFILPLDTQSRLFEPMTPTVAEREVLTPGPRVHRTYLLDSMLTGLTTLNCYEPLRVRKVAAPGPMVIRGAGEVTISNPTFSPNRVTADVVVGREPVRVVLNENFAEGWLSTAGPVERDPASAQPSVVLPGSYRGSVAFSFVPPGLWTGFAIWFVALALSVVVWRRA